MKLILIFLAGAAAYDLALRALWKWVYRDAGRATMTVVLPPPNEIGEAAFSGVTWVDGEPVGV